MSTSRIFARPHLAFMTRARRQPGADLEAALDAVSPDVKEAFRLAAAELSRLGIRCAVCGGLAVGALGYPRATKDVDFLVGDEAFEHHGPIVTSRVPFQVGGIAVDAVHFPDAPFLDEELPAPGTVTVVSPEALTYMKLRAGRLRDRSDIVELIKVGGLDIERVRAYLGNHAPALLASFEKQVETATQEAAEE